MHMLVKCESSRSTLNVVGYKEFVTFEWSQKSRILTLCFQCTLFYVIQETKVINVVTSIIVALNILFIPIFFALTFI